MPGLERQGIDQVRQAAEVQRPAQTLRHAEPRQGQALLGVIVLADDDRHHRPGRLGRHLEDLRQSGDICPPIEVDQGDNDLIVF